MDETKLRELQLKTINDFLAKVIEHSHYCAHCIYNHNGKCFFAYNCIKNDFIQYNEGDD